MFIRNFLICFILSPLFPKLRENLFVLNSKVVMWEKEGKIGKEAEFSLGGARSGRGQQQRERRCWEAYVIKTRITWVINRFSTQAPLLLHPTRLFLREIFSRSWQDLAASCSFIVASVSQGVYIRPLRKTGLGL